MSLSKLYKTELYKYLKKPITLVLFIGLILPVFYGLSILQNAQYLQIQGSYDAMFFASVNWNMLAMTGVPEVLFALVATHIFAYELERGQIRLLIIKVCDRRKVLLSKFLVQISLIVSLYIIYYLVCMIIYYTIIIRTPLGNGDFGSSDTIHYMVMDWIYLIQILLVSSATFYLGIHYKAFTSFMISVGLTVSLIFLEFFPVVKYFVPAYTAKAVSSSEISSVQALALSGMFLIASFFPIFIAVREFKNIDIT